MNSDLNLIMKHAAEALSVTKMMKNAYNSAVVDNENISSADINIMLDLIIEKMNIMTSACNKLISNS